MNSRDALNGAVDLVGLRPLAAAVNRSYQAVQQWQRNGRLPRTDHSGETHYAALIAQACRAADPHTMITREALLGLPVNNEHADHDQRRRAGEAAA